MLFSSFFDYLSISDGNEGNNFQLRIGYQSNQLLSWGYEYFYQNYKEKDVVLYYSPQNFNTNSIWADFLLENQETTEVSIGGKIGYAQSTSQLILEGHLDAKYQPLPNLTLLGNIALGQSTQYDSAYRYASINFSLYWTFW